MNKKDAINTVWSIYKDFHPKAKKDDTFDFMVALLDELVDEEIIDADSEWYESDYEDEVDEEQEEESDGFSW